MEFFGEKLGSKTTQQVIMFFSNQKHEPKKTPLQMQ